MKTDWRDFLNSFAVLCNAILIAVIAGYCANRLIHQSFPHYQSLASALSALLGFGIGCIMQARILLKIRPIRPGSFTMSDNIFTYWKLYSVLYYFGCGSLKPFTIMFFRPLIQQLFGATIGRNIALGGTLVDPHLIEIGDEAIIGEGSILAAHAITPGKIMFAPIKIASRATVGVNAVVMPGVSILEGAILLAGAVAVPHTTIPAHEIWGGIPARPIKTMQHHSKSTSATST